MPVHRMMRGDENHPPHAFEYANAAAREAAVLTVNDIGKLALQTDDWSLWSLRSVGPVVWKRPNTQRLAGFQKLKTIYENIVPIPAAPDAELMDDEISLGVYARFAHTPMLLCSWAVEKPDGNGGWVATAGGPNYDRVWDFPAQETDGYEVFLGLHRGPKDRPFAVGPKPTIEGSNADTIAVGTDTGRDVQGPDYKGDEQGILNGESRLRVWGKRSSRVYSPEEQAAIDALGYRLHVLIQVKDFCVWEKEVSLVGNDGDYVMEEEVDVSDYGLTGGQDNHLWVVEFRRNGKTVRSLIQREYRDGEQFDPPTLPVGIIIVPKPPLAQWWGGSDATERWEPERYGYRTQGIYAAYDLMSYYPTEQRFCDGVWVGSSARNCNSPNVQKTIIRVRRRGAPLATYMDGSGYVHGTLDLKTLNPAMDGVLTTKVGWPQDVIVSFVKDSTGGVTVDSTWGGGGVTVHFNPGVSTLQDVWNALNAAAPNVLAVAGALNAPGFVLTAEALNIQSWETSAYVTITGAHFTEVPVPAGSTDNCTVRVRLLAAPDNLKGKYPWLAKTTDPGELA